MAINYVGPFACRVPRFGALTIGQRVQRDPSDETRVIPLTPTGKAVGVALEANLADGISRLGWVHLFGLEEIPDTAGLPADARMSRPMYVYARALGLVRIGDKLTLHANDHSVLVRKGAGSAGSHVLALGNTAIDLGFMGTAWVLVAGLLEVD